MNIDDEATEDLFKYLTRVCDFFNWDLSKREDPDDAEEVWIPGMTWDRAQALAPLDTARTETDLELGLRAFSVPVGKKPMGRHWQ